MVQFLASRSGSERVWLAAAAGRALLAWQRELPGVQVSGPRGAVANMHHVGRLTAIARRQASMDSPTVTQLFRQLFSHRASQCLARGGAPPSLAQAARAAQTQQHRGKATTAAAAAAAAAARTTRTTTRTAPRVGEGETKRESRWQPRRNAFPHEREEEFQRYPLVTSDMLRGRRERPRRVRMLLRDFIEGSHHHRRSGRTREETR